MIEEERKDFLDENGDDSTPASPEVASLIKELAEQKAKAESNLAGWQRRLSGDWNSGMATVVCQDSTDWLA